MGPNIIRKATAVVFAVPLKTLRSL